MKYNQILSAAALVALAFASQAVFAGIITTTYAGSANFGSGGVGYYVGSVAPNPISATALVGVGIGGDSFTSSDHTYDFSATGQFNAWCVDIYHWLSGGTATYNIATGADLAAELNTLRPGTPAGATRVTDLVRLANEVYSTVNTEVESAAFQLAVWTITYGNADTTGHYHITPYANTDTNNPSIAGFMMDSGTASSAFGALANTWLNNLGAVDDTENYKLTYLSDGTPINNRTEYTQDLVVFTSVPEPATFGLLAIGLFGLGFGIRKRG
ncbi:MAG: hypothetical protein A3H91_01690 [Gammaproteobacteria bacterium RIFCSPLOWO2_02_FULL_61_13]|nr:MAG: hypothetical protein A3H91_01690 [Gammaproteobacteria bacterium RIFCSPLOWO2_02_FULL_61_13]